MSLRLAQSRWRDAASRDGPSSSDEPGFRDATSETRPHGSLPTVTVFTTVLVEVLMTLTVPLPPGLMLVT